MTHQQDSAKTQTGGKMKYTIITILALVAFAPVGLFAAEDANTVKSLDTEVSKLSYAFGMDIGKSLQNMGEEIDLNALIQAMKDIMTGNDLLLTHEDALEIQRTFIARKQAEMADQAKIAAEENKQKGDAFLKSNAAADMVVTTDSGLQYIVLKEGDGPSPSATDTVKVHYSGTLLDGTIFDSSYTRGQPATFQANQVIPGWQEGLQLMKTGAKFKFFIPSSLAYGERGAGQKISPNATLIFEVELLEVVK